jgi:hypothetical protein
MLEDAPITTILLDKFSTPLILASFVQSDKLKDNPEFSPWDRKGVKAR